jgi:serine/threonine protein phosphatase PrpC
MYKQVELKLKSSGIDYSNSGTCALGVLIEKQTAFISNLGNSRAVLYRKNNKDNMAIEITYDHNPNRPDEKERIIKLGGKVEKVI